LAPESPCQGTLTRFCTESRKPSGTSTIRDIHFSWLERLAIHPERLIATAGRMLRQFGSAIGTPTHITNLCVARQARYLRGMGAARALFERQAA